MAYESLTYWERYSAYEVDANGRVAPAPDAVRDDYDPFRDFNPGSEAPDYQPPYYDFMRLPDTEGDEAVLSWLADHGVLGLGSRHARIRETVQDIRAEALRFQQTAEGAESVAGLPYSEALIASAAPAARFDEMLSGRRYGGEAVRLMPRIAHEGVRARWETGIYAPTLIQAFYAMLLVDLTGGRVVAHCKGCGRLFTKPAKSRREFCPPEPDLFKPKESKCAEAFRKREQRKKKGGEAAKNDTRKATRKKGGTK